MSLFTNKDIPFDGLIPDTLNTDEFKEAWTMWVKWRKAEHGRKVTAGGAKLQLKNLASWGAADAIRSIETSMMCDWTGLFKPPGEIIEGQDVKEEDLK